MSKVITLLGSTGSIGTQSLDVCRMHGYEVFGLSANSSVDKLLAQIAEFHPKYVADLVPKQAYTMGIKTIMQARKVLMVANGKGKADIVKKAFFGPVTPEVPASILQMHPDFILVGDEEALSEI